MNHAATQFAKMGMTRDRDQFLRELLRELSGVLEDTVGLEEAEGFIALVGGRIGEIMDAEYREAAGTDSLSLQQLADALVDLKARIRGGFSIESVSPDRIVLINDACPFGRYVAGRQSLCMMTSNVFGRISANNMGYAKVELVQTQARGDPGCRVIVHLTEDGGGREYFG